MNKKLQVFVSSTYTDLIEERQAAVEAILDAGHIPAGMELFKAGNESQLKTIYKWIDESDVYMLILGGRYGSIEEKSSKSYTQLEYEYALNKDVPVFTVVLSEAFLTQKINNSKLGLSHTMEQKAPDKYQAFKTLVMSKIIREVDDCKDIKLAVHSTLNEFLNEYDLTGWVRNSNESDTLQLLKDNNILLTENRLLNNQLKELKQQLESNTTFGNFSFNELVELFKSKNFKYPPTSNDKIANVSALDFYYLYFNKFATGIYNMGDDCDENMKYVFYNIAPYYIGFNFLERVKIQGTHVLRIQTTKLGDSFYAMLEYETS